jgi:hypothetical protein
VVKVKCIGAKNCEVCELVLIFALLPAFLFPQVDETSIGKVKWSACYKHRGRETRWATGFVERGSKLLYVRLVDDRSKATMEKLFRDVVEDGTMVISDGRRAYDGLDKLSRTVGGNSMRLEHRRVFHEYDLVSIDSTHNNNIENCWSVFKRRRGTMYGTSARLLQSHLDLFGFRWSFCNWKVGDRLLFGRKWMEACSHNKVHIVSWKRLFAWVDS